MSKETRPRRRDDRPPRGVRPGQPWWAYALLVLLVAIVAALTVLAITHDYAASGAVVPLPAL